MDTSNATYNIGDTVHQFSLYPVGVYTTSWGNNGSDHALFNAGLIFNSKKAAKQGLKDYIKNNPGCIENAIPCDEF